MEFNLDDLNYDKQLDFEIGHIPCLRDPGRNSEENDVVQIFNTSNGLLGIALGMRNTGFYIGLVLHAGAPVGFGKVLYLAGSVPIVAWTYYPYSDDQHSDRSDHEQNPLSANT